MFFEKLFTRKTFKSLCITMIAICMFTVCNFAGITITAEATGESYKAGVVTTSSGKLNVRSSASTSGTIKTQLAKGIYVTLVSKSGTWWYIRYGASSYGYCSGTYITEVSSTAAYVSTASTSLNIRSSASTSSTVITQIAKGSSVVILGTSGSFYKVLYNGSSVGYAHINYITPYSSSSSSSISLNVPSYKQYDSRWRGHYVGNSGKTIYQIGCLTTCFAMNESYITGTTIYPDEMESRLTYTSGGSAYWPSKYSFYTSSSYLSKILSELKEGDAVIVGAKNSYGSQHWVVVTGYTKNGSVTADDFKINDPGSASRTTLAQFFAAYPTFYKLAYV